MQLIRNERRIKREGRIAAIFLGVTFFLLGLGLLLSIEAQNWAQGAGPWGLELGPGAPIAITYGIVIVGMVLYYLGNSRMRRFGPQYRQEARLRQLLKNLDDRHVLYAFLDRRLPDYLLVGPNGVFTITARPQTGEIVCHDDRWSRRSGAIRKTFETFYGNPVGSPSYDTARNVQKLQAFLQEKLPDGEAPPVTGLIAFTGENVRLRLERCSFPAVSGREIRRVVGKPKARLTPRQVEAVRGALESTISG